MPIPRRGYVDGTFGQIHYQSPGLGPAVMLLHQAPMTSAQFDNVYEPLARQGFLTNTGDVIHDSSLKAKALRPDFARVALDGWSVDIVDQQPEARAVAVGQFLRDQTKGH